MPPKNVPPDIDRLYRELIDSGLGLICAHDLDGNLLMVNRTAADALGYDTGEMEGHNLREFIPPDLHPQFDEYIARIKRLGTARGYLRLRTRSGESVTWLYRNRLARETDSQPIVLGHAQDITWRLELERRLRDLNESHRRMFDEAPIAYHEIDRAGVVVKLNQCECKLLGYERDQVVGKPVWDLVAPEQRDESKRSVLRKLAGEQPLVPFVREYVRRDGERLLVKIHENLIRSRTGEIVGIRSTLLDVTEQSRIESKLRELNVELDRRVAERTAELDASHRRMREFVFTVSHDLQEPLRSMGSFARLLVERYSDRLDADGLEFLSYVTSGTTRMSQLVRDLLSYSRALHNDSDVFENVSLTRAVEIVKSILGSQIEASRAVISHGALPVVRANPNRIIQLLQNLLSNAIKYRKEEPPVIHLDATLQDNRWKISVTDNGLGIAEADRERVFGLFKRGHQAVPAGSGVGLAICRAIVERHGGRIWVEAAPGGGSVFSFTLPRGQMDSGQMEK